MKAALIFARTDLLLVGGSVLGCVLAIPSSALAQDADQRMIVVSAPRPTFDIAPERTLDTADVESYGRDSIGEILEEVTAENGDRRDDPVILVNGKRVGSLGSVEDLPAEAISKIEVLPIGSGLRLGATSNQRVYNIQLKRELDMVAVRAAAQTATRGSWMSWRGDVNYTQVNGNRRITLAAKFRSEEMLRESERDIVYPAGASLETGLFRSLAPARDQFSFSLSAADQIAPWLSGSLSAKLSASNRQSLLGPVILEGTAIAPVNQSANGFSVGTELALNATAGSWLLSLLGNYAYDFRRTLTDRLVTGLPGVQASKSIARTENASVVLTASGPLVKLPAGSLRLNLGIGLAGDRITGDSQFQGVQSGHETTLHSSTLRAGVEVPIASRSAGMLAFLGDLSATAEVNRVHVSGFGTFTNHTYSAIWQPARWLRLTAAIGRSGSAPPIASLDEPPLETPGVAYFDPLTGETVVVTRITGGITGLPRQSSETTRFAANIKPVRSLALQITAEYLETRQRNTVSELPPASPAIIQAFPDRFIRNSSGQLIVVDARPVSFASRVQRQLRTGISLNLPLGRGATRAADEQGSLPPDTESGAGVRPRLQINASHTFLLKSNLVIRAGQPAIDLLLPEAVGFGGLGQPRHVFDLAVGYAERGLGLRLTTQHRSRSFIEASGSTANVLSFEPLTTFSLRAWVQGERLAPTAKWLKGTRISLSVANLTDVRERVVNSFGFTPLSYQPAYRDPIGRTIEIELRKRF